MPATLSYPGVYIEEIPSGVHTITGVATSIGAFFGRTARGPLNKAVHCLSPADFSRAFGGPHPDSDLAQSVQQFFDNGGSDCYIVRLAAGANTAAVTLTDLSGNTAANHEVLIATAKNPGAWGNGLRLEVDYNTPNPDESFNLTATQFENGKIVANERYSNLSMDPESPRFAPDFVTEGSALIELSLHPNALPAGPGPAGPNDITDILNSFAGFSQSRAFKTAPAAALTAFRTLFEGLLTNSPSFAISVDEEQFVDISLADVLGAPAPKIAAGSWSLVDMATRLEQVINPQLNAAVAGLAVKCEFKSVGTSPDTVSALRITADAGQRRSVRIRRATANDFAIPMSLGIDQGGIESTRYSNYRPAPTGAFYFDPQKVLDLAALTRDEINKITIDSDPSINFNTATWSAAATDIWVVDSQGGSDGIREKLRAIANAVNSSATSNWEAEMWGYHLVFTAKNGSINQTPSAIVSAPDTLLGGANFSRNVRQYALGNTGTSTFQAVPTAADKGDDGSAPTFTEYKGNQNDQTGFYALDAVDLFNLMVIPGDDGVSQSVHSDLWGIASIYCEKRRAFLLIDAPVHWSKNQRPAVVNNTALVSDLRAKVEKKNSAVFYPLLKYRANGLIKSIGPSGAVAGLMARTDSTRGVWKAPAGTEADIRGILGMEVKLTDLENGVLNKIGVNCLRIFPTGFVNWGARTMFGSDDDGSEWKYIPIRRLALFLEESLFRGTKWVVFEPNDEPLWAKVRLNVGAFMMRLFRQGAFQGSTPDKAFYVKCDGDTTTQADRDLGIVNIEVGFAPLKPAEFVVIKIQQMPGDLE